MAGKRAQERAKELEAYERYEEACKKVREENQGYLDEFESWLAAKGLKDKTIKEHLSNVGFYINEYLLREDAHPMADGTDGSMLEGFFGDFFVRKCMWSSPSSVRSTLASLKKFYLCMKEKGHLSAERYAEYLETVKESKEEWLDFCKRYNDGEEDDEFSFLFDGI